MLPLIHLKNYIVMTYTNSDNGKPDTNNINNIQIGYINKDDSPMYMDKNGNQIVLILKMTVYLQKCHNKKYSHILLQTLLHENQYEINSIAFTAYNVDMQNPMYEKYNLKNCLMNNYVYYIKNDTFAFIWTNEEHNYMSIFYDKNSNVSRVKYISENGSIEILYDIDGKIVEIKNLLFDNDNEMYMTKCYKPIC